MTKPLTYALIPFAALHISSSNMRDSAATPDISDILPSVRKIGIQQPIIVREEARKGTPEGAKTYGVVAGRRRLNCLIALQLEHEQEKTDAPYNPDVPCMIIDSDNDAAAIAVSLLENIARQDATPMQEYKTFAALANPSYAKALINGEDLSGWHDREDWQQILKETKKGVVGQSSAKELTFASMIWNAKSAADQSGKTRSSVNKYKEVRFKDTATFEAFLTDKYEEQQGLAGQDGL